MKKTFLYIDRVIEKVGNWGLLSSGILMLVMGFLSTYAVARRYLLNSPEPYSYELSTIFLTACVVLAISGLQRYKRHLRVDFIANYLPPVVQVILMDVLGPLLALVFVVIITWQSWLNFTYSYSIWETSQTVWREPLWPTKLVIPVCMFWLCLTLIAQFVHGIVTIAKPSKIKATVVDALAPIKSESLKGE